MATKAQAISKLDKAFKAFTNLFSEQLQEKIKKNAFIAGGAISSIFMNEEPNDYDVFFRNSDIIPEIEKELKNTKELSALVVFVSDNAITLSNKYQIIKKIFGEPETLVKEFDFAHNSCYYNPVNSYLGMHEDAFESMASKNLIYQSSKFPFATLVRLKKFLRRGWNITAGQILKICLDLQKLDLNEPTVLKEQLNGIDLMYLSKFLEELGPLGTVGFNAGMVINLIEQNEVSSQEMLPPKEEPKEKSPSQSEDKTY